MTRLLSEEQPSIETLVRQIVRQIVREELSRVSAEAQTRNPSTHQNVSGSTVDSPYLTVPEAARLARVSNPTIRRWIVEDRLTARGAGRDARVLREEVVELIEHGRQKPRAVRDHMNVSEPADSVEQRAIAQAKRETERSQHRRSPLDMPDTSGRS